MINLKILDDVEVKTLACSTVADNTRRIIDQKGLKHGAVAARAGYSEKQFSAILCKRRAVKDVDIIAISEALGVTPNDLLGFSSRGNA